MTLISRSNWRKLVVLVVAILGFVLLYETRMLDSQYLSLRAIVGDAQPPPGSRLQFDATAYCKGTTTASGVGVRTGIAAADPQLLPVGSVLNVATGDQRYNGVYTVMDTGPRVQGRLLDLYMWSCNEALRFGRRGIQVTVLRLGWDPTASSPRLIDRLFRGREARRRVPEQEAPPPAGIPPAEGASDGSAPGPAELPTARSTTNPAQPPGSSIAPQPEAVPPPRQAEMSSASAR
jgi:3D (Asp-Asp-Asp) domain-containing protein